MKETELRIGNYVSLEGIGVIKVLGILPDRIYYTPINSDLFADYLYAVNTYVNPLPLTEEWLLKFGFGKQAPQWNILNVYYGKGQLRITFYNEKDFMVSIGAEPIRKDLYVHEIQNLYFALIGEELTIV